MNNIKCVKVEPNNEVDKLLYDKFTYPLKGGWVEVGESKTLFPVKYEEIIDEIENFDVREDDIFVVSHPRSGTTWTMEMVWLIENDCDFEAARKMISGRYMYIEGSVYADQEIFKEISKVDVHMDLKFIKNLKESRFIKTHLPWDLLPKKIRNNEVKPKIICVTRNPKDVCVSLYHFYRSIQNFPGTIDDYYKIFLAGRAHNGPYWNNFFSYWNRRNESNILIIKYEDMKTKIPTVIKQVANFLNRPIREDQVFELAKHLSFETMKYNMFVNYELGIVHVRSLVQNLYFRKDNKKWDENFHKFMRKGKIGSHKEEMPQDIIKKFDAWIAENTKGTGLKYD